MSKRAHEGQEEEVAAKRDVLGSLVTPDLMKVYYDRVFPTKLLFRWLSYKNDSLTENGTVEHDYFARREFTMNLPGDIYIRWQSYETHDLFRAAVIDKQPARIELGAVYSFPPKLHMQSIGRQFVAMERELVFDIDMDEYDEIRTCCEKAAVCKKCWRFMGCAIEVLQAALEEDFGFQHILFVFSGRRGVHCWVGDESARVLQNDVRSAVAEYMNMVICSTNVAKKVTLYGNKDRGLHPAQERALKICSKHLLAEGGILDTQHCLEPAHPKLAKVLDMMPAEVSKAVKAKIAQQPVWTSRTMWYELDNAMKALAPKSRLLDELVIELAYPRLDIAVSKGTNHLLKAPFCIHPKSGKVCVPLSPKGAAAFDPGTCPTVRALVDAINQEQVSPLQPYLQDFQKWVDRLVVGTSASRKEESERSLAF